MPVASSRKLVPRPASLAPHFISPLVTRRSSLFFHSSLFTLHSSILNPGS
ncbi:MAG: hypothetical protein KY459_15635 [Acidobacteria bacterium]|nr:hypothetical protein [Acidobacteriota bacterium]